MTTTSTPANQDTGRMAWKSSLTPLVLVLGGLLVIQLLAALFLGLGGSDLSPTGSQGPLLAFEQEQVTRVRIESSDKEPLVLEKTHAAWRIPSLGGFPAAEFKVNDLLTKLGDIQSRIPVATSEAAMQRFKVVDSAFERRVTLEGADGALATLYLGDSPGFRRLFVRAAEDNAVYEAELSLFDASDKADDWTEKTVLHLPEEDIRAVRLREVELKRTDGGWQLADLTDGDALDQEAVNDLIRTLANLTFRSVLGTGEHTEYAEDVPALSYQVTLGDETLDYSLYKLRAGEDYALKVSNQPHYFRLSQLDAQNLLESERTKLIKESASNGSEAANIEPPPSAAETGEPGRAAPNPAADVPSAVTDH